MWCSCSEIWLASFMYSNCACGFSFSVKHCLSCLKHGLPSIQLNEIRDFIASFLTEICPNVSVELELLALKCLEVLSAPRSVSMNKDYWTCFFHTSYFLIHWWHGSRSYVFLQKTCILTSFIVEWSLLNYNGVVKVLCHTLYFNLPFNVCVVQLVPDLPCRTTTRPPLPWISLGLKLSFPYGDIILHLLWLLSIIKYVVE